MTSKLMRLGVASAVLAAAIGVGVVMAAAEQQEGEQFPLPPGWTMQDMTACMMAGTPGEQHKMMAEGAGTWSGPSTMWMYPGADPIVSPSTSTVKPIMGGRYVQIEWSGEIPGMGAYHGMGLNGYDNAAGQYVSMFIDNHSTAIVHGTGKLSGDGNVMTWTYQYTCPVTKKPTTLRQIETMRGPDAMTLEMFGIEPKSGKEFKMMQIEFKRQSE